MITSYSSSDDEITSSTCEHVILVKVMLMMAGSNQKIYISEANRHYCHKISMDTIKNKIK
jgi:hypothetical protein